MTEKTKKADPKPVTYANAPEEFPNLEREEYFDLRVGEIYLDTKRRNEKFNLSIEGGISVYYQKDAKDDEPTPSDSLTKEDVADVIMDVFNKILINPNPQPAPQPTPAQRVPAKPTTTETQETVSRDEYEKLVNSVCGMQNALTELMKAVEKLSSNR